MARGDIQNDVQSIVNNGNLDFQPASGDEYIIFTNSSTGGNLKAQPKRYDGTNAAAIRSGGQGTFLVFGTTKHSSSGLQDFIIGGRSMAINNTDRIRITNTEGTTQNLGYSGIQTK